MLTVRQVGAEELGALEATAEVFRAWGHQFGGGLRRKAVVGQLSELGELLREPHPQVLRRRLLRVTAKVAIVAGHMTGDSARDRVAYGYYALALDAAREAADDVTGARVAAATARLLVSDGRCRDAALLLDRAGRSLRQAGPDAAALLVLGQAWALAQLGRHEGVARALDRAAELTRDSNDGSLLGPAEVAGMAGACLEALARQSRGKQLQSCAERAVGQIARALSGRDPVYVRSRALDLVGLADVRLCQRELDEALAVGGQALEQVGTLRSVRAARRIHRLAIRALEQFPGDRQAAAFAERVRAQVLLR